MTIDNKIFNKTETEIGTKIEDNLPAVNQQTNLDNLLKEAGILEYSISGLVYGFIGGLLAVNFCAFSLQFHQKQLNRFQAGFVFSSKTSGLKAFSYGCGMLNGIISYTSLEAGIGLGSYTFLGPAGLGLYLGTKAVTNYFGYQYYKKQRELHDKLEKTKLL